MFSRKVPTILLQESNAGIVYVTNHTHKGEKFIANMTAAFNTTQCSVENSTDVHNYSCKFVNTTCDKVGNFTPDFQFKIDGDKTVYVNDKDTDLLVEQGDDCLINMVVMKNPNVTEDFMAVSLHTIAKSHYLIYDFNDNKLGFGGNVTAPHKPDDPPVQPSSGLPVWAILLIVAGALIIVGLSIFIWRRGCAKKTKSDLEQYEALQAKH